MYRDQIVAMYQQYKVLKARFVWNATTSNANAGLITIVAYNTSPPSTLGESVEFSRRPPIPLTQYESAKGSFVVDIATGLGLQSAEYAMNSAYNVAVGSNPTTPVQVQFALAKATATDTGCALSVLMELDVLYLLPLDPGQS